MRRSTRTVAVVLCGLLPSMALAGALPDRFTLGGYLPADVWLYAHGVHNPERAWLDKEWSEVCDALKETGIDRDLASLLFSLLGEENRPEAEATLGRWTKLIKAVRWADLVHDEAAFAERLGSLEAPVDYFFLARGKPGSAEGNMAAVVTILKELAALSDKVNLTSRELDGVTVWSLACGGGAADSFPFGLEVLRKGDVIAAATSRRSIEQIAALMTGRAETGAIVSAPRFQEALATAKAPEDSLMFFDMKALMTGMNHLMDAATTHAKSKGQGDAQDLRIVGAVKKAMALCNVMDYTMLTVETDGRRELTHEVARLQKGKQKNSLAHCCLGRKPFERFDQFIPADATGFNLSGLLDFEGLYKLVIDFIRDDVPDGAKYIEKWNGLLATIGFDPKRDLFSWWSGEMVSITLPPAVVTPMSSADWVVMFRVKDTELASRKINAAIDFVNDKLQAKGQVLMVSPAAAGPEGFREVTHPVLMMSGVRIAIGVKDGWLMIGSSSASVSKCLNVAAGKAPSIMTNKRFMREGLVPKRPVLSCSFKDTSKFGQECAAVVGMVGMFGGMITAPIPDKPETRKVKQAIQKLMTTIVKLGPVLQRIDFYSSESSMTTYDGALTVRTEKVVTYKPSAPQEVKTAEAE